MTILIFTIGESFSHAEVKGWVGHWGGGGGGGGGAMTMSLGSLS